MAGWLANKFQAYWFLLLGILYLIIIYFWYLTDFNHLKCFVEVSKCTADEYTDKSLLTNLYSVGEHFAALIYNLPVTTEFDEFHKKCKSVLDVLKRRPYLADNLVSI